MIIAAVGVSALAALIMIWVAGLSGSLLWSVIAGLLITLLLSSIIGLLLRRDVLGPFMIFGLALVLSLSWLYPGSGGLRPDPVAAIEWINRPDGSRLAVHITRAATATQPPVIAVHGGPGVADMAHDAVPQLHPDPADEPLELGRLAMIKLPVLVIKPACDYSRGPASPPINVRFRRRNSSCCPVLGTSPTWSSQSCTSASSTLFSPASNCLCPPLTRHPPQTDTVALGDGVYPWP